MASAIKMDELLVSWLSSDDVYQHVMDWVDAHRDAGVPAVDNNASISLLPALPEGKDSDSAQTHSSPRTVVIPPFYPTGENLPRRRRRTPPLQYDSWEPLPTASHEPQVLTVDDIDAAPASQQHQCARDMAWAIYEEAGQDPPVSVDESSEQDDDTARRYVAADAFVRLTKEVCRFPSYFNSPVYQRILLLWNSREEEKHVAPMEVVTFEMFEWFWKKEMEPFDALERFYRLVKQPASDSIVRDDFLPFIRALLNDHPGLEFLTSHAEFQEKYAVTVITRIFYIVNKCHSGRITSRQLRRSDLLEAFLQVDEEEDINKVTRYFSYEHFYVLYCRFWELDHDRDYRLTREDLLKYGDHSLSHMIVDRIFDAAPRPFLTEKVNREYLSYEDFIYFMLSEEDKSNEVSVRYWFSCVDVDGDGKLNNMEMRSFYAVQLHRMQCMGHEIVPFEDMLCQMMDMIKPASNDHIVVEDFMKPECNQVSGALFDALFNLNKYLMFEQRDPFVERQKREDEFECDWDRFACIDYNRLAMEEEAREEEAMEIDWVSVDDEEGSNGSQDGPQAGGSTEAPF